MNSNNAIWSNSHIDPLESYEIPDKSLAYRQEESKLQIVPLEDTYLYCYKVMNIVVNDQVIIPSCCDKSHIDILKKMNLSIFQGLKRC